MNNRKNSIITIGVIILSALGSISIGFATWYTSSGDDVKIAGNINVDAVKTWIRGVGISTSSSLQYGHYYFEGGQDNATIVYSISFIPSEIVSSGITNFSYHLNGSLSFYKDSSRIPICKSTYITDSKYNNVSFTSGHRSYSIDHGSFTFDFNQLIESGSQESFSVNLSFTFSNKMIAKYGSQMDGGMFLLHLEAADDD